MVGEGSGAKEASYTRVRHAWGKFRELSTILTSRGTFTRLKGKIYSACVHTMMVNGSETWPMKVEEMQRLD
jgi:hypothetical protein